MSSWNTGGGNSGGSTGGGSTSGGSDWIGALVNAGASIYNTHQQTKTSKENTNKTIAANKAEAELAYQRSLEMWHMQNMYNTPEAQMQRFKEAGLNPHLIYGQGNSGNASAPPNYHPPNIQYQYEAPTYGDAVQSILPTLMSVGTWARNMELTQSELEQRRIMNEKAMVQTEKDRQAIAYLDQANPKNLNLKDAELGKKYVDIENRMTETDRARQMIAFLEERNPRLLQEMDNKLSLFPYQKDAAMYNAGLAAQRLDEMQNEFRYKYGEDLWRMLPRMRGTSGYNADSLVTPIGGAKRLEFLRNQSSLEMQRAQLPEQYNINKLSGAKSMFTDYGVTDPQALAQMVLGTTMQLATRSLTRSKMTHETESRMSTGRVNIRRRIYEK